jgi:hypothetical protein
MMVVANVLATPNPNQISFSSTSANFVFSLERYNGFFA